MAYTASGTNIIYEVLDDEVIIANLDAGIYYSTRNTGAIVWQYLLNGHSLFAIEALFKEKYGTIPSLTPFLNHLLDEHLLISSECKTPSSPTLTWPSAFLFPILERYDEMKNLLMLDPIHEVDEQGWPQRK